MDIKRLKYLEKFLTDRRVDLFDRILEYRTRYLTVVLEDIYQPNNASAVLRSCDCFGIQDVYIIENENDYVIDREVSMGSHKWLNLHKFNRKENNTGDALRYLRKKGYRIIATSPHSEEIQVPDFDIISGKAALFFGTELNGLSEEVMNNADEYLRIPMFGFTESFNISVSAAIVLDNLVRKLHDSKIDWHLTDEEKYRIKLEWTRKSIKNVKLIEEQYLKRNFDKDEDQDTSSNNFLL